jgi:hypothetical protein
MKWMLVGLVLLVCGCGGVRDSRTGFDLHDYDDVWPKEAKVIAAQDGLQRAFPIGSPGKPLRDYLSSAGGDTARWRDDSQTTDNTWYRGVYFLCHAHYHDPKDWTLLVYVKWVMAARFTPDDRIADVVVRWDRVFWGG